MSTLENELSISESSKRTSEDSLEGERPAKCRRVQFSDVSSLRFIEPSVQNNVYDSDNEADLNKHDELNGSCSEEMPTCPSIANSAFDVQILTKQRDGAAPATIATQKLIRVLLKQRSISTKQVIELLGGAPEVDTSVKTIVPDLMQCATLDSQQAQTAAKPALARPDPSLCLQVIWRLRALSNRIEKYGKAAMLPCTTNLGPHFLPAIRFLASSVAVSIPRAALVEMAQG